MVCDDLTGEEGGGVGGNGGKVIVLFCTGSGTSALASWATSRGDSNCPGLGTGVLATTSPFCCIKPSSRFPPPLAILTGEEVGGVGGDNLSPN